MATKTKTRKPKTPAKAKSGRPQYPTNSKEWQRYSYENELCMRTGVKVPLKEQYTVHNDLITNTAIMKKNAARKGAENLWHGSKDAAEKRQRQNQRWLNKRAEEMGVEPGMEVGEIDKPVKKAPAKAKAKPAAKKAPAKRKPAAAKKAPAKRAAKPKSPGVRKPAAAKAKAATMEDPF